MNVTTTTRAFQPQTLNIACKAVGLRSGMLPQSVRQRNASLPTTLVFSDDTIRMGRGPLGQW